MKYFNELDYPNSFKTELYTIDGNPVDITWNNAWYITPSGYLYNSGVNHKEGNLYYTYTFCTSTLLHEFRSLIKYEPKISYVTNKASREVINRGYITEEDFKNYTNFSMFKIPDYNDPSGKNLVTLITGYLEAKRCLINAFRRLNDSKNKEEIIGQLDKIAMTDFGDLLVCFAGFHKIESMKDKTITTSSLISLPELKAYTSRGWTVHVIPAIIYDRKSDSLKTIDLDSLFVQNYLERELPKLDDKVKVFSLHKRVELNSSIKSKKRIDDDLPF